MLQIKLWILYERAHCKVTALVPNRHIYFEFWMIFLWPLYDFTLYNYALLSSQMYVHKYKRFEQSIVTLLYCTVL